MRNGGIKYPSIDDIIALNKRIIVAIRVKKADAHKVLSRKAVEEALSAAQEELGDVYDKATTLLIELIRRHPFASANRRTAFVATKDFLEANGERVDVLHDLKVLQGIREHFYTKEDVKRWLKGYEIRRFSRT